MFNLLKIRMSIDILKNKKCKVTFGLEYICTTHLLYAFRRTQACAAFPMEIYQLWRKKKIYHSFEGQSNKLNDGEEETTTTTMEITV